jgi:hypothetical protein
MKRQPHAHPVRQATPDEMIGEALRDGHYWSAAVLVVGTFAIILIAVLLLGGPMP